MNKKLLFIAALLPLMLGFLPAHAQQDAMYSQYMFNQLAINPAYTGSRDALAITLLGRRQWVSIPGAPKTETVSLHTPSPNGRYGYGFNLCHDRISYIGQTWLNFSYAYRIPLAGGNLAFGLQGTLNNYNINWGQAFLIDGTDNVPLTYGRNLWLPNAGTGAYFSTKRFYAGLSVPRLLVNSLDKNRPGIYLLKATNDQALLKRHVFASAGVAFPISQNIMLKPSMLIKYVQAAPLEVDLNLEMLLKERFWIGGSWRTGDGIVAMIQYQFSAGLRAGYAYDYPFTRLGNFTTGSHELMIGWDIRLQGDAAVSPRYF